MYTQEIYHVQDETDVALVLANELFPGEAAFSPHLIGEASASEIGLHTLRRVITISSGQKDPVTKAVNPDLVAHLDSEVLLRFMQSAQDIQTRIEHDTVIHFLNGEVPFTAELPQAFIYAESLRNIGNAINTTANRQVIRRIESVGRGRALLEMLYAGWGVQKINSFLAYAGIENMTQGGTLQPEHTEKLIKIRDRLKTTDRIGAASIEQTHDAILAVLSEIRFFNPGELELIRPHLLETTPVQLRGKPVSELATIRQPEDDTTVSLNEIGATYFRVEYMGLVFGAQSVSTPLRRTV